MSDFFLVLLWVILGTRLCSADKEPLCLSRYDYDYKVLSKLVDLEYNIRQLSEISDQKTSGMKEEIDKQRIENDRLAKLLGTGNAQPNKYKAGSTYTRWGRTSCPGNGSDLVYSGYVGGSWYDHKGGAAEYICLPQDPTWNYYEDKEQASSGFVYGTEYELDGRNMFNFFGKNLHDENVPCAVCSTERSMVLMIPARNICYDGWTLEYHGYLVGGFHNHGSATQYVCLDGIPESFPNSRKEEDGKLLYFIEVRCGSLPCPPYVNGREMTCAVCSK